MATEPQGRMARGVKPASGAPHQPASSPSPASRPAATPPRQDPGASDLGMPGFGEFTRMLSDMKLPGLPEMQALMDAHRRNLETLTAANRVALEGAQAVARRHLEIMQQSMAELSETVQALSTTDAPQAKAARQAELLKRGYERAVTNMRELRDMIQRSNGEALEMLNRRFAESIDEVHALIRKAGETK